MGWFKSNNCTYSSCNLIHGSYKIYTNGTTWAYRNNTVIHESLNWSCTKVINSKLVRGKISRVHTFYIHLIWSCHIFEGYLALFTIKYHLKAVGPKFQKIPKQIFWIGKWLKEIIRCSGLIIPHVGRRFQNTTDIEKGNDLDFKDVEKDLSIK